MKAGVLKAVNEFHYEDVELGALASGDVRIRVAAAGICGSDIHKMQGHWKYQLPMITGHEFAGVVEEIGSDVQKFKKGDRVAVAPLIPCYECYYCRSGQYQMCEEYTMTGTHRYGGFAEYCDAPQENIIPIGDDLSFESAAMIEPLAVASHGVIGIEPKVGDIVAIFGLGTIGLLTLEWLKLAGVKKIIGIDIDENKLIEAKKRGCTHMINPLKEDLVEKVNEYTDGMGVDISMECAGSKITEEQCLLITRKQGKIGYQGIAYSDVTLKQEAFENIFRRECTIKGFWNSYSSPFPGKEWFNSVDYLRNGMLKISDMISHRFELADLQRAFNIAVNREESYNKIMIYPNGIEFAQRN
ncbi:L-iditol 2-dehydrogenase [Pilibacter termitis]|uniref:L-iditol 2-dehydrogenase n=1 Tax=Pilibacter termitis TaxID=263852 RepID=A0A1T4LYY2_9ENTE|nr:galactitol-1-phosphate 5-dehydrogenase [Pilibacter termitis]SJZ59872.1 L-iditol 2-dehydrogenase [Pilibacter termitis]